MEQSTEMLSKRLSLMSWDLWLYTDGPHPREERQNIPKFSCAQLVAPYPKRLEAVITAQDALTKYWLNVLYSADGFHYC